MAKEILDRKEVAAMQEQIEQAMENMFVDMPGKSYQVQLSFVADKAEQLPEEDKVTFYNYD